LPKRLGRGEVTDGPRLPSTTYAPAVDAGKLPDLDHIVWLRARQVVDQRTSACVSPILPSRERTPIRPRAIGHSPPAWWTAASVRENLSNFSHPTRGTPAAGDTSSRWVPQVAGIRRVKWAPLDRESSTCLIALVFGAQALRPRCPTGVATRAMCAGADAGLVFPTTSRARSTLRGSPSAV